MAFECCSYFGLLVWKNFKLKFRHKKELIIEFLVPLLFFGILFLIRKVSRQTHVNYPTIFDPVNITSIPQMKRVQHFGIDMVTLAYAPNTIMNDKIATNAAKQLGMAPIGFASNNDLETFMMNNNTFYGILFNSNGNDIPKTLDFTLRMPPNLPYEDKKIFGWNTNMFYRRKIDSAPLDSDHQSSAGGPDGYIAYGLASLQNAISNSFIKLAAERANNVLDVTVPDISMQRFPYPPYMMDPTLQILSMLITLIFVLSFSYLISQTVKHVTLEKELQLTETMKIMGLRTVHHWSSWFFTTYFFLVILILIITIILKVPVVEGTAILPESSFLVIFLFLLCYGAASITFAFFISSFFYKPVLASSLASLIWIVVYIPFTMANSSFLPVSTSFRTFLCLLLNTAMGFGFKSIIQWELNSEGAQFSNLMRSPLGRGELPVGLTMIMLLVDAVLYMLLTVYVEKVFPGRDQVRIPWNFWCKKDYWCSRENGSTAPLVDSESDHDPEYFEDDPANANKKKGVSIQNLKKRFGEKVAVDNLSLDMYEDEITVLLGHNGAGKTTTISMITGYLMPSQGKILVNGLDTSTNMSEVRKNLGVCPQHNILFNDLTVEEHIIFYSRLKGLDPKLINVEIDKYLRLLQLEDKRHALSSTLSGGMKRKLSLGVALCGGSKVVLCDEPSSGMDPEARRALWNLLETEKTGRTILLTTHFMDEADVLGDRVAIMSGGRLVCAGTSFFLKKKFGTGYQLICSKTPQCDIHNVTKLVEKYIPAATIKSNVGTELSYNLPDSYVSKFEALLGDLEKSLHQLGLNGYGISMTTLEDVFMKTGSEIHKESGKKYRSLTSAVSIDTSQYAEVVEKSKRSLYQWRAMFFKKYTCMRRNYIIVLIQILLPILLLCLTFQGGISDRVSDMPNLEMTLNSYGQTKTVLAPEKGSNIGAAYRAMFDGIKEKHQLISTSNTLDALIALDKKTITFGDESNYVVAATVSDTTAIAWFNNEAMHTVPLSLQLLHNAVAKNILGKDYGIRVGVHPLPYSTDYVVKKTADSTTGSFSMATNLSFAMSLVSSLFVLFVIREKACKAKLLQFVSGIRPLTFWTTHFIMDMAVYAPVAIAVVLICLAFQVENFTSAASLANLFFMIMLYGLASLAFTYLLSHLFDTPANGLSKCFIINLIAGMGFLILIFVLKILYAGEPGTVNLVRSFCLLIPTYGLAEAVWNQGSYYAQQKICEDTMGMSSDFIKGKNVQAMVNSLLGFNCDKGLYAWDTPGLGMTAFFLAATFVGYFALLIALEYNIGYVKNIKNICIPKRPSPSADTDNDVQAEKDRVENMGKDEMQQKTLVMQRLTKYYRKFLAVNNLSLCVEHGECFGLLGINGAGKTSAFKMLTGDENISYGDVFIEGYDIRTEKSKIYERISYCPQFDALLTDMSGYELLKMFCLIQGIPRHTIKSLAEQLARDLAFEEALHRLSGQYSGGNRRKLSTALALLGDPHIVYLDEPTAGIDPASRRKLWDMVCMLRDAGKGIILTSHSMEECEALCTRLAIMVNGEFKCLGSTQHLKNKFSTSLTLSIKLKKIGTESQMNVQKGAGDLAEQEQKIVDFINRHFQGATLKESRLRLLTFEIPLNIMPYSRIFGLMESNRNALNIEDYSLTQATLEQIFLQFAKEQRDASAEKSSKKSN